MPRLSDLTDYQVPQPEEVPADLPRVYINGQGIENKKEEKGTVQKITDRLLGLNGEERYQLWPEKVVREGLSAAGDVMSGATPQWAIDPATGDVHTSPQMVEKAQAISALAGTGGLGGVTDATLGSAPFLRPALKYKDRLYKGKEGQSHQDVIPEALYPEFNRMAMSGEDISHYNFGFHNDKGHFLNREDALKYGIDTGLIDPQAGRFGALTSTLMADSSKPGTAIEAMAKTVPQQKQAIKDLIQSAKERNVDLAANYDGYGNNYTLDWIESKGIKANPREGTKVIKELADLADKNKKEIHLIAIADNGPSGDYLPKYYKALGFKPTGEVTPDGPVMVRKPNAKIDKELAIKIMADSSKEAAAIQSIKEPFYSALEHNVAKINQSKMTGDQWLGTLSNKPGVKPEELDWTGLKDFLKENGKIAVTKEQIESHLAANKVELKEVNKGVNSDPYFHYMRDSGIAHELHTAEDIALAKTHNANFRETFKAMSDEEILKLAKEAEASKGIGETKYHSYQLPGGENYREMLLTLPKTVKDNVLPSETASAKYLPEWNKLVEENRRLRPLVDDYNRRLSGEEWNKARDDLAANNKKMDDLHNQMVEDTMKESPLKYGEGYKSSHWDEPNILAHVRMNDRVMSEPGYAVQNTKSGNKSQVFATEAEAKDYQAKLPASVQTKIVSDNLNKKSLHLEEIQSDYMQSARTRGFKSGFHPQDFEIKELSDKKGFELIYKGNPDQFGKKENFTIDTFKTKGDANNFIRKGEIPERLGNVLNKSDLRSGELPDAPFEKTWHELALKRMIREAAEKGYDRLSWTPGEAQAARYDLSKQVNMLSASGPDKNGKYLVYIEGKDKQPLFRNQNGFSDHGQKVMNADEIEATVGKEPAKKLIEGAAKNKNNEKTNGFFDLKDDNLKIGGEGMKGFYDQIIPKSLERIGKEHGVKVKSAEIPVKTVDTFGIYDRGGNLLHEFKTAADAHHWDMMNPVVGGGREVKQISANKGKQPIHYIDIPQSLKDQAMHKGFPLFSSTHMFTPISHDPFEKKK